MRLPALAFLASAALTAIPALAAEPPFPTTDFSGTWVVRDGGGNEFRADMRYSAAKRSMRMETAPGGMEIYAIRDMKTGEIVMWSSQMPGMGMRIATPAESKIEAEPTGEKSSVNGETCEVWTIEQGTACLGAGNVPLRTEVEGTTAELEDLKRGPQDASLFEPPAGLNVMTIKELSGAIQGMELPKLPF